MSKHLELFEGQVYISRKFLLDGKRVPLGTVKDCSASKRVEKRELEIGLCYRYSSLPESVTSRLPYASVEAARQTAIGTQVIAAAEQAHQAQQGQAAQLLYDLSRAVVTGWERRVASFTRDTLTPVQAEPYTRLQAALDWCLWYLDQDEKHTRTQLLPAFQALNLLFCPTTRPGADPTSAYVRFSTKLSQYAAADDKAAFLLKKRGAPRKNDNALKMGPIQQDWLVERFAQPLKISREKLCAAYARFVATEAPEWPELGLPTIKKMLDKTTHLWYARRHGLEEGKKRLNYLLTKERTSQANRLIEVDGTEEPFLFRDELGKREGNIYCVRAWDAYSGCIVGSAYGTSENAALVRESVEEYLLRHRKQPQQFRFDRGRANLSPVVQELLAATGATSFASQARRPTGRSSERLLGEFQNESQYALPGFRGSNYRSTRNLDRKVHPDRLATEWLGETRASIIARCRQAEEDWNNSAPPSDPDGPTRLQRYQQQGGAPDDLSLQRLAQLLCVERKRAVRYTPSCLQIEAPDGTRHFFEPQLPDGSVDLDLHMQLVGERALLTVWELRNGSRELVFVRRADGTGDWLELRVKRAWTESLGDKAPGEQQALSQHWAREKVYQQTLLTPPDAPVGSERWRLEQGPEGQDKDEWNAGERQAIMAESAERAAHPAKRAVSVPPQAAPPLTWSASDNRDGDGVEPALLGLAPSL